RRLLLLGLLIEDLLPLDGVVLEDRSLIRLQSLCAGKRFRLLSLQLSEPVGSKLEQFSIPVGLELSPGFSLLVGFVRYDFRLLLLDVSNGLKLRIQLLEDKICLGRPLCFDNLCLFIQLSGHNLGLASDFVDDKLDVLCNLSSHIAPGHFHVFGCLGHAYRVRLQRSFQLGNLLPGSVNTAAYLFSQASEGLAYAKGQGLKD